ncbi:MAG TPA: ATP-binding protein [Thiothrix sp.]|nr:ATP-binding protein [Thiothrix sp.]
MECHIHSEFSQVKNVSERLYQFAKMEHIDEMLLGQLELLLVEAVNNVIEHAYRNQAGHPIYITFTKSATEIIFMIKDQGRPLPDDLSTRNKEMPNATSLPEGGWGLSLIYALANRVEFSRQNETNTLTLVKTLN